MSVKMLQKDKFGNICLLYGEFLGLHLTHTGLQLISTLLPPAQALKFCLA